MNYLAEKAETSMAPERELLEDLQKKVQLVKTRLATEIKAHEAVQEKIREITQRRDYARTSVTHFEKAVVLENG